MIRINELNKTYGSNRVLNNINCSFERGKIYGIVGKNGAGKSTLFKCISGLESYDGDVIFDTHSLEDKIGLLPTTPFMMSKITGKEYLRLMCQSRGIELNSYNNINLFNLPLTEFAEHYSTGMLKKLAINALLLQKNEIFILDEPFNGLDLESNLIVKQIIQRLKEKGRLILISSHILTSLYDMCDAIDYLKDGHMKEINNSSEFSTVESDMTQDLIDDSIEEYL